MQSLTSRQHRRTVFVEVQVGDQQGVYMHKARNLSTGGIFLDAPVPLPVGTRLDLQFQLPGGASFRWLGEVRWTTEQAPGRSRTPGMGVIFVDRLSGDPGVLAAFVEDEG